MILLPEKKVTAVRKNPKKIIIFSNPKVGKTTAVAALDNNLILDFEEGTDFMEALKINIIGLAKESKEQPLTVLKKVLEAIKQKNESVNGYYYKYITIDTVTALETLALDLAGALYRETPMGRNWTGTDVTKLPQGAGYQYLREALSILLNEISKLCDTLIILGHLKAKLVEFEGKEMESRGLDLTGKSASILCSQVDAIGFMYREDEETKINFKPSESLVVGTRAKHLEDKIVTVIKKDDNGKLIVNWDEIFIN